MAIKTFLSLKDITSTRITISTIIDNSLFILLKTAQKEKPDVFAGKCHYEIKINQTLLKDEIAKIANNHHNIKNPNNENIWIMSVFLNEILRIYMMPYQNQSDLSNIKRATTKVGYYDIDNVAFYMAEYIINYISIFLGKSQENESYNNKKLLEVINSSIQEINTSLLMFEGIARNMPMDDYNDYVEFRIPDINVFISHGLWFFNKNREVFQIK